MAYVEWENGTFDLDSQFAMTALLSEFDQKLQSVGLIKVASDSTEFTMPPKLTSVPYSTGYDVQTLSYKLPKGNGVIQYEDVVGQTYKKIKKASYVDNDCYVQFKFKYLRYSAVSLSDAATNPNHFKRAFIFYCDLLSKNSELSDYKLISSMGNYRLNNSGSTYVNSPYFRQDNKKCYILLSEQSLVVYFLNINGGSGSSGENSGTFNRYHTVVQFILNRNKNNTSSFITQQPDSGNNGTVGTLQASIRDNALRTNNWSVATKSGSFYAWSYLTDAADVLNGEIVIQPCWCDYYDKVDISYYSYVIRNNLVPTPTINQVVIRDINGVEIMTNYLNMGDYDQTFKPMNRNDFTFCHIIPEYELTTENL